MPGSHVRGTIHWGVKRGVKRGVKNASTKSASPTHLLTHFSLRVLRVSAVRDFQGINHPIRRRGSALLTLGLTLLSQILVYLRDLRGNHGGVPLQKGQLFFGKSLT